MDYTYILRSDTPVFLKDNVEVLGSTECKNKKVSTHSRGCVAQRPAGTSVSSMHVGIDCRAIVGNVHHLPVRVP